MNKNVNKVVNKELLKELVEKYKNESGPLIPILQEIQENFGYLPEEALIFVSDEMDIPLGRIWGVVTFYSQFYLSPRGRNIIRLCQGTACHVRGARRLLEKVEKVLGVKRGETTPDFEFTLETVRCLGTCFLAPVIMINHDYFGRMTPDKVKNILQQYSS